MTTYNKNKAHPFILLILLTGLFFGGGGIFYFMHHSIFPIDLLFACILVFSSLSIAIHYVVFKKDERYLGEVIMYCIGGWGCLLTALFLAANFFFHSPEKTTLYSIQDREGPSSPYSSSFYGEIDAPEFKGYSYLLNFEDDEINPTGNRKEAKITEATGLFGIKIILKKELE